MKINEIDREVTVIDRPTIGTASIEKPHVKPPNMYEVILYNDEFTHAEFVVDILQRIFNKSTLEAINIMMDCHKQSNATVGIYPKDVAETKVMNAMTEARAQEHPLQMTAEPI